MTIFLCLLFSTFITQSFPTLAHSMHTAKEKGKEVGKKGQSQALSKSQQIQYQDLLPPNQRGETFDPQKAKEHIDKEQISSNPTLDYLQSNAVQGNRQVIADEEYFLQRSEQISQNPQIENLEIEEAFESSIEMCQKADAPYPISVVRDLHVEVAYDPGITKDVQHCLGHVRDKKFSKKKSAENTASKWEMEFASDPSIKIFRVKVHDKGILHKHIVEATWTHRENVNKCRNYQTQQEVVREPKWEEVEDTWVYQNDELLSLGKTPDCTFIRSICLDATPSKQINGKEVKRQCWQEQLTFLCQLTSPEDCPYIRDQNCELIKKKCLTEGPYGCSLWELTFKCYSKIIKRRLGESDIYGMDEEPEYEPNNSFSEITAKFAVFDEIKKDLEKSQTADATAVQVFKGQNMQCSKSIVDEVMYDCCFSHSGLAKELGLTKCSADEISLAEMRELGLCHYVGSYAGKFFDLWKSRDEHVFCCFGSKLARILQFKDLMEQAHD